MSVNGSETSGSETAYADSIHSLTASMAEELFTSHTGSRYSALNDRYIQAYNEPTKDAERVTMKLISGLAGGERKLWWEPKGREGLVDEMLGSGRILEPKVLDIGCGIAGVWISDVAASYPQAEVIGLDLVPVEANLLPSNVIIEIWDCTTGLPFPDGYFTVVHIRYALYWMAKDYSNLIQAEVRRVLAPGGALIVEESDANLYNDDRDPSTLSWAQWAPKNVIRLERIVFANLHSLLASCPADPYIPSLPELAFSEVYSHDWDVHLGWRDGAPGEPASTRTGNHVACLFARLGYLLQVEHQKPLPWKDGKPSDREMMLKDIARYL